MIQESFNNQKPKTKKRKSELDKICSKLQLSVKHIDSKDDLPRSVSNKIQKYINKDNPYDLQRYLDKKVIDYDQQIGIRAMKWNILHFCAKNNSKNILTFIMPKIYQENKFQYQKLINSKTSQGYTPLMISIIYSSNQTLQLLLKFGGMSTQQKDNMDMTAYQIALNYKNQNAIKSLMEYESNVKKKINKSDSVYINQQELSKPINQEGMQLSCPSKFFQYIVDCFICFKSPNQEQFGYQNQNIGNQNKQQRSNIIKKSINPTKMMNLLKYMEQKNIQMDIVNIGSDQIQTTYKIEWKKLSSIAKQNNVLFDSFQPFDIHENNLIIANNLIIFQCLSDHTWLLRKILKPLKKSLSNSQPPSNTQSALQFTLQIYVKDELKSTIIDEHIPFLIQKDQPIFLSNLNETWPQLLQKGLAKIYGSYMKLTQLQPLTFIQNLTGSFTKRFLLNQGSNFFYTDNKVIKDKSIISLLQEFNSKGYMILLEGRQSTTLMPKTNSSSFKTYCYTVLNYYEKGNKRLILVNCPYVLSSWKQKQKNQTMQLKLIKSHYNTHNQMCVWIQENQFSHFFKSIIVSFTEQNINRTQLKIKFIKDCYQVQDAKKQNITIFQNITNSVKTILSSKQIKKSSTLISLQKSLNPQKLLISNLIVIKKSIFIRFNIQNSKKQEYFSIAIKNRLNYQFCKVNKIKGWINGGISQLLVDNNFICPDLIRIQHKKGQYLCMFQIQFTQNSIRRQSYSSGKQNKRQSIDINLHANNQKIKKTNSLDTNLQEFNQKDISLQKGITHYELLAICWSQDIVQMQQIQQQFAVVEWIQHWKRNSIKNWNYLQKKITNKQCNIKYVCEKLSSKVILLTKSNKDLVLSLQIKKNQQKQQKQSGYILQGILKGIQSWTNNLEQKTEQTENTQRRQTVCIEFIRDSQNNQFQYVVLGSQKQIVETLQNGQFQMDYKK